MSEIFGLLDNGNNFYDYLEGMISTYGLMTYHTYPAPNYDAANGGVTNNSWNKEFSGSTWLTQGINNGTIRTMITEFGWNPGQMGLSICNLNEYSQWPNTGACAANDGYVHTFENDINSFITSPGQLHGANVVAVWIERGGPYKDGNGNRLPDADGLDYYGNTRPWFHNYQFSSP